MMKKVLITTDFSAASRHGLDYTCLLLQDKGISIELLHVFPLATSYTADSVALSVIQHDTDRAEELMREELEYVRTTYPGMEAEGRMITGSFLETIREEARTTRPHFIVLGTSGGFDDIYTGNEDPLEALRSVPVPVLFVPQGAPLRPVRHIAYACNYAGVGPQTPVQEIIEWVRLMDADFDVFHTDSEPHGADEVQTKGEAWLKEQLAPLAPEFYWEQHKDVLHGIAGFVGHHGIDCLLIVPKKYGMWENLFRQSRTKALARWNRIPLIAFHPLAG